MAEQNASSIDSLVVDDSPEGIFVFDKDGALLRDNGRAAFLVESFEPGAIILCENDILKLFNLDPLRQKNIFESKYISNPRKNLSIQRKWTDSGVEIYYLMDTTGERLRMAALHQQTSDTLWKIRSRVTSIQNALSYLIDYESTQFNNEIKNLLSSSRFEVWQLSRYADNLRDLALLNANVLEKQIDMEVVSLKECIVEAVMNIETFRENWGKKVFFMDRTPELSVRCDKNRFIHILESVLINSIMYGPANVIVTIDAKMATDEKVNIIIKDNGDGLSDADLTKVFEYGYRGNTAKKAGSPLGLGIELFIAQQTLTRMDGGIFLENGQNEGTEATFILMKGSAKDERPERPVVGTEARID
jgi:signal transduction histidine kinase